MVELCTCVPVHSRVVLFGGAIFMVLGLSLEKFHEARAETLPGGGWGVRRHCLERRARASRNFASSGPRPSEGRRAPNERESARTAKAAPHANEVAVRSWRVLWLKIAVRRGKGALRPCTWSYGCGEPLGAALGAVLAPLRQNLSGRPKPETERRFARAKRTSSGKRRIQLQRGGSGGLDYGKVC
jgi:hypothetical protein